MSKWSHIPEDRKKAIFAFNKQRAVDSAKAADLATLLNNIPKGQLKQLYKNEECAVILAKYGITEE